MAVDTEAITRRLVDRGVRGVGIGWVDNNGILRSRTVPVAELPAVARRGVGITAVFAVFDSHDGITFAHEGLSTPSGDVRLLPVLDPDDELGGVVVLAGQPGQAWVPGRQVAADGSPWPYDQRGVLERQVARASAAGFGVRAGFEMEMMVTRGGEASALSTPAPLTPAHRGPAYSPLALLELDGFVTQVFDDLGAHGIGIGQFHAEYGAAQVELALAAQDPLALADTQVLTRLTLHAAARAHGLRISFAPVPALDAAGNGWHLHTSLERDGANALTGTREHGLSDVGLAYLAGLLRDLPGVVALTAPSTGSLLRRRPGYWAGAYAFWGVENREAALRLVPGSALLGSGHTNVELKACDASANPFLALAVTIAAGLGGIADGLTPPPPVQEDVGTWDEARRASAGIAELATTHEEQQAHLLGSDLVRDVLGPELLGAFAACRDADAAWAAEHSVEETLESLRWVY